MSIRNPCRFSNLHQGPEPCELVQVCGPIWPYCHLLRCVVVGLERLKSSKMHAGRADTSSFSSRQDQEVHHIVRRICGNVDSFPKSRCSNHEETLLGCLIQACRYEDNAIRAFCCLGTSATWPATVPARRLLVTSKTLSPPRERTQDDGTYFQKASCNFEMLISTILGLSSKSKNVANISFLRLAL